MFEINGKKLYLATFVLDATMTDEDGNEKTTLTNKIQLVWAEDKDDVTYIIQREYEYFLPNFRQVAIDIEAVPTLGL
jgi:hypothetical protein